MTVPATGLPWPSTLPDAWSEAELIAEYKAAFGLDNADAIDAADGFKDRSHAFVPNRQAAF